MFNVIIVINQNDNLTDKVTNVLVNLDSEKYEVDLNVENDNLVKNIITVFLKSSLLDVGIKPNIYQMI